MKTIFMSAVTIVLFAFVSTDELIGRWECLFPDGNILGIILKADKSLEGYFNKKPFLSGTYSYSPRDSVFSFVDNGCQDIRGIYKIDLFSNSDSMRWEVIKDSCDGRRQGMNNLHFGRVK